MKLSPFRSMVKAVADLYSMDENTVAKVFLGLMAQGWGNWRNL